MDSVDLEGIRFEAALKLGPLHSTTPTLAVGSTFIRDPKPFSGPGVYLVYQHEELVYIGKYKNGLKTRWIFTKTGHLYHFKKTMIAKVLAEFPSTAFTVFAASEESIRNHGGQFRNNWINAAGIEEELIRRKTPPWNRLKRPKTLTGSAAIKR